MDLQCCRLLGLQEFEKVPGSASLPSSSIFLDFCSSLIFKLPRSVQNVTKDTVVDIEDVSNETKKRMRVTCSSGQSFTCQAVVIATSGVQPIIPAWAADTMGRNIQPYSQVDVRDRDAIRGKSIAVFGGGMTAATLALQAVEMGAKHVYMITRRELRKSMFDCDPGWWGIKELKSFYDIEDPHHRLTLCQKVRNRGSITPKKWDSLLQLQMKGKLTLIEGADVSDLSGESQIKFELKRNPKILKKDCSSFDKGTANRTAFSKDLHVMQELQGEIETAASSIVCDTVWIACGNAYNIEEHPILSRFVQKHPITSIGGYPVLSDACSWPDVPLFIAGRGSMLTIGPCAGNMVGMKMSAERISPVINGIISGDFDPTDLALHQRPQESNGYDPVNRTVEWLSYNIPGCVETETRSFPLESDNVIQMDMPTRKKTSSRDCVYIEDVDPSLKKVEIQNFCFMDDDFKVSVILNMPEPIPKDLVRVRVTSSSLEAWLIGKEVSYHLHVPKMYGRVLPERSRIVTKEEKNRVTIILCKERDAEWHFLKG